MGLSQFPTAPEGVLPLLVINTVFSVTLLKNMVMSVFQIVGSENEEASREINEDEPEEDFVRRRRRISIIQFKSMCKNREEERGVECCVCLCGFKEEDEVSELVSCKHFFHRACLDNWFGNSHTTCPLCRSIL